MKERIWIAVASVVLAAVILLLLPSAHPAEPSPTLPPPTKPTHTAPPTTLPEPGAVQLYSCDGDWVAVLTELAAEYTALTGTQVTVLSPAEGEDCQTGLARLMRSKKPPTVFCFHSAAEMAAWRTRLLDLQDTVLSAALCSDGFGLVEGDKILAFPMDMEAFGLLVNADLLASKGSYTHDDIDSLASLTTAVQILKSNSTNAFPVATMADEDALRLLSAGDPADILTFLNLYITNCNTSGEEWERFLGGKSVFCLGTTADYDLVAQQTGQNLKERNLDILPTYAAGAMQYFCTTAWGVNGAVRQEDVEVTLAFLAWLGTAAEGNAAPVDRLQSLTPFADAAWYGNQLEKKLLSYMRRESAVTGWEVTATADAPMLAALNAYIAAPGDETWAPLQALLEATE